jgi:cobalt/nickel transport system permease protein
VGALYLHGHSAVHRLPAHVKIVTLLLFLLLVVSTPREQWWAYGAYLALLVVVAIVAQVPTRTVVVRMAIEIPFVLFAVLMPFVSPGPYVEVAGVTLSQPGLVAAGAILAKATLGIVASILLAATTTAKDLLYGLARMRLPGLIVTIAAVMLRYAEVVSDEMHRMSVARASRCFDARGPRAWRVLAQAGGALFIRSYERGERVHLAMLSRGFTGRMPALTRVETQPVQWAAALALPVAAALVLLTAWTVAR